MIDIAPDAYLDAENQLLENMLDGFGESVKTTTQWLKTERAREAFLKQHDLLSEFFTESGIEEEWNNIIRNRAKKGANIADSIYDYARSVQLENRLVPYTPSESKILNRLVDNTYELVRNVTESEINGIRRSLLQDYAEGRNPMETTLKQIELEPINGLSPTQRAQMIARTESGRILNTEKLERKKELGVEYVRLVAGFGSTQGEPCEECEELAGEITPIDWALENPIIHPNCRCTWVTAKNPEDNEE